MAVLRIPVRASSARPSTRQRVRLDGRDYLLDFDWNAREGFWYLHLSDQSGTAIACGLKLAVGGRIAHRVTDARAPAGAMVVIDTTAAGLEAGIDDLLARVLLAYVEDATLNPTSEPAYLGAVPE